MNVDRHTVAGRLLAGLLLLLLPVTASAAVSCAVSGSLQFGTVSVLQSSWQASADHDMTGEISVTCTGDPGTVNYALSINQGTGAGATEADRRLTRDGGSELMRYTLYRSSNHLEIWGTGANALTGLSCAVGASCSTHTVYGRIFGNQTTVRPGSYADVLTITISY